MKPEDGIALSPQGDRRRREILDDALHVTDRRRDLRAMRQLGVLVCIIILIYSGISPLVRPTAIDDGKTIVKIDSVPVPQTKPSTIAASQRSPAPKRPAVIVEIITAADVKREWETLDDDQLLATLADAGHPSGIARLNGRSFLVPMR